MKKQKVELRFNRFEIVSMPADFVESYIYGRLRSTGFDMTKHIIQHVDYENDEVVFKQELYLQGEVNNDEVQGEEDETTSSKRIDETP